MIPVATSAFSTATRLPTANQTQIRLLLACAEYDPPIFQAEALGLLQARFKLHCHMLRAFIVSYHSHYALACHLGTADDRLEIETLRFIENQK